MGRFGEKIARMERNAALSKIRRAKVNVVEWDVTLPLRISMKQSLGKEKDDYLVKRGRAISSGILLATLLYKHPGLLLQVES